MSLSKVSLMVVEGTKNVRQTSLPREEGIGREKFTTMLFPEGIIHEANDRMRINCRAAGGGGRTSHDFPTSRTGSQAPTKASAERP